MLALWVTVAAVLLTSATCSLFEAVLYSVPPSHVEALAQRGRAAGRILRGLRQNVDRPIAAILFLNTLANTGGATVAGALAAGVWGNAAVGYFSAALTLAILTVAEMIPKNAGVVYAKPLAAVIARPLELLVRVFAPVIWLGQFVTRLVPRPAHAVRVTDEEVLVMVRLGMRSGDFKPYEAAVIQNILALEAKTAGDIMTPRMVVFALGADQTVGEVRGHDRLLGHSRIPAYGKNLDDIVGVVHRPDVLVAIGNDRFDLKIEALMRPAHFVLDSTPLDRLLRIFLERRQHLVIVVDEFGGFAGVVTLEDVLEEILGREIVDESDRVADLRQFAQRQRQEAVRHAARPKAGT